MSRILLVRPNPDQESVGLQSFMICEPLELEYVAAYLEQFGHEVVIVDMLLEKRSLESFLAEYHPDLVGFTAYITHVSVVKRYAETVKKYNEAIITVLGGIYAEVRPQECCSPCIDFVFSSSGIKMVKTVLETPRNQFDRLKEEYNGIWNGPEKKYPPKERVFDLPHPDRSKTAKYRHQYNYIFHSNCALLKTSFGCPYSCEFCYCVEITDHHYFTRDLHDCIDELASIKETNIFIVDDDFLFDPKRVEQFCDLLEERKLKKRFILFGRADFIAEHETLLKRFYQVGLRAVFVGLESFTQSELGEMNKRISVEQNVAAVRVLERCEIECHAGIIINPDWGTKDFDSMAEWIRSFRQVFVNFQPVTPMPGTPLYESVKDRLIIPQDQYEQWDMVHLVLRPKQMSIRQFYFQTIKLYYRTTSSLRSHGYILRKYGFSVWKRTMRGALHITGQYIRLWIRG